MRGKPRARVVDKERYKKKQKAKKAEKELKKDRAISRESKNFVRRQIKPYFKAIRDYANKSVLIIMKDTENMERILLKKDDIGKGMTFLSLPIIREEEIENYLNSAKEGKESKCNAIISSRDDAIKGLAKYLFSVSAETVMDSDRMIVLKDCRIIGKKEGYITLNVRPYNVYTWYTEDTTSIFGRKVYKGKKLNTFFETRGDISKTYICYDSLAMILLYRSMVGKIAYKDFLEDHLELAQRQFMGTFHLLPYRERDEQIKRRFRNEEAESQELNLTD